MRTCRSPRLSSRTPGSFSRRLDARTFLHACESFPPRYEYPPRAGSARGSERECSGCSSLLFSFLLKLAGQQVLDAMNFGGNISGGEPGNLADRSGVEAFQIGQDHVAVERFQALDQVEQSIQILRTVGGRLSGGSV